MFYLTTHSTHLILRLYDVGHMVKEGRKEMFYLTTHSTHFILWLYGRKEGNVLFNDALNTFYFTVIWRRTYGKGVITVTYHFSDLQEVYSDNRQIHTKCQLQYFHPPHISTSGKSHCVIIHQTTKATEYIG